jgi:PPOX class probable F420-dependent enzyme
VTEDEAFALVAGARVARLGTVNDAGGVDLVPVTFALDGRRLVSAVDHKPKTTSELRRLTNIERRPEVTVLVDHYEDDWSKLWWVRLRGRAVVVRDGPQHAAAVAALAVKYAQYADHPPAGPAIVVDVVEWRAWSG